MILDVTEHDLIQAAEKVRQLRSLTAAPAKGQ